jgi:hypothetical protein
VPGRITGFQRLDRKNELCRIQIEGLGVDVHKHWCRTQEADDFGGGDEGERGGEDGVSGTDAVGHERHEQRVRAAGAGDRVLHANVCSQSCFQFLDLRPHDVLPVVQDPVKVLLELGTNPVLLGLEVDEVGSAVGRCQLAVLFRREDALVVSVQQQCVAGEQDDLATFKTVECANELFVFRVLGAKNIAFAGQRGQPVFIPRKISETMLCKLHALAAG